MISLAALATILTGLVVAPQGTAAPAPAGREQLLTLDDYATVYPDMGDPIRVVLRSPVLAPRGCVDQNALVGGTSRIQGSVSPVTSPRSVSQIDQNVVDFGSTKAAKALVQRYRFFSKHCVDDVHTDDGEGGKVILKNRSWVPPRVGDQSAGMLIGWLQSGSTSWRRVLVTRVGRTVSVLDVSFEEVRPPEADVLALGALAVERLG